MKVYFHTTLKKSNPRNKSEQILKKIKESGYEIEFSGNNKTPVHKAFKGNILVIDVTDPDENAAKGIAFAIDNHIPTAIIFNNEPGQPKIIPMFAIKPATKILIRGYTLANVEKTVIKTIRELADYIDNRYTLELTPPISNYLNWVSDNKKTSRGTFIRNLIEKAAKKDTDYRKYLKNIDK